MRRFAMGLGALMTPLASSQSIAFASSGQAAPPFGNPVLASLNILLVLAVVIVLVVFSIRFLARLSQVQQKGAIQVLAARQVAPNRSVQVIDVQGRQYLIGVGDQITLLAEMTGEYDTITADSGLRTDAKFGQALADALRSVRDRYRTPTSGGDGP